MDKIIEYINQKTQNKFENLIFENGVFDKNTQHMKLFFKCPQNAKYENLIEELTSVCTQYLKDYCKSVEVHIKSNVLEMSEFKSRATEIINSNSFNLLIDDTNINFDFGEKNIVISVPYFENGATQNLEIAKQEIERAIFENIFYDVEIKFQPIASKKMTKDEIIKRENKIREDALISESIKSAEIVKITTQKTVYGEAIFVEEALSAGNFDNGGKTPIYIAGKMKNFTIRDTKPKEAENQDELKPKETKKYFAFDLEYNMQSARFFFFPPKDTKNLIPLDDGKEYVIACTTTEFGGRTSYRVKSIAECQIVPPKILWRVCPQDYTYVKPERYEFSQQLGLFQVEETTTNKYLKENTFVVYDLETTGTNTQACKIIDIGAYKIVNGKIVDKFCTFVNPQTHIPEEASKVNRITDDMVQNYPTIDAILPDFFKYCNGATIVGYNNIGFDDMFINREGRRLRYNFDNPRKDAFLIAKDKLKGLKNYKLGTVCEYENVPLIDAHRAANDALATAKLFIKLVEKFC